MIDITKQLEDEMSDIQDFLRGVNGWKDDRHAQDAIEGRTYYHRGNKARAFKGK